MLTLPKIFVALTFLAQSLCRAASDFSPHKDSTHEAFDTLLRECVAEGAVNYSRLKENPAPLASYLDSLATISERELAAVTDKDRFALLINLYNAATLKLVVDHYPVHSIKDIGGIRGPWKQPVVRFLGQLRTLDDVEHGFLRPQFHDPRLHMALVCAARGCPPLRAEAYVASHLDQQLDDQVRRFLAQTSKNRVDAESGKLFLSPIFKWYRTDFETDGGSVETFLARFLAESERRHMVGGKLKVSYTDYDWSLNDQRPRSTAPAR